MKKRQFKAGYISDAISKVINEYRNSLNNRLPEEQRKIDQIDGLLKHVSSFDVEFPYSHQPDYENLNPALATINNIITRGLPTRAPVFLEELLVKIGLTHPNSKEFEFDFSKSIEEIDFIKIFELLHIVEPGLKINRGNYAGQLDHPSEWRFLNETLEEYPFVKQILQPQRDFATIANGMRGNRRVDFSYEFPYKFNLEQGTNGNLRRGVIFEIDGAQHNLQSAKLYDEYRNDAADQNGFDTLRQSTSEIGANIQIENQFRNELFSIFRRNYNININENISIYSLIFIPLAVARIQKTFLECLLFNGQLLQKEIIKLAVIERDLPCAAIALKIFKDLVQYLNELLNSEDVMECPLIDLTVFPSEYWTIDNSLHLNAKIEVEEYFNNNEFDIIIDHSILKRSGIYREDTFVSENSIKIRSSHYFDNSLFNSRKVYCGNPLKYKKLVRKLDHGDYETLEEVKNPLTFFLQTIFRKKEFREGQVPIISRALELKPVIGLLPTGGGKSLAYQLPAFLQPGLTLIVDPIKSLMQDQVRVLNNNWIDCCDFINSTLIRDEKTKRLIDFRYGETMFLFISPERFIMDDFRTIVKNIDASPFLTSFIYCVIDEVHCVSEWGHDFRTTYLMLGKNAQTFAKTKTKEPVSLLGLTATASFDVLADVERELQIQHEDVADAIVMIENTIRPELFFKVINVTGKNRLNELNQAFTNISEDLNKLNNQDLALQSREHHKQWFTDISDTSDFLLKERNGQIKNLANVSSENLSSIIFCAVRGQGGHKLGVDRVYQELHSNTKGFFYSSDNDETNETVQNHFHNFLHKKINHMICTKAFGMGIDKDDIRSTFHFSYSNSFESLVQEVGRSGRDKKISEANILVSLENYYKFNIFDFFKENSNETVLKNKFTRKAIRENFHKRWNNGTPEHVTFPDLQSVIDAINQCNFSMISRAGRSYNIIPESEIIQIRSLMYRQIDNGNHKYIYQKYYDREIHDFFHDIAFKGVDTEKSQLLNLFNIREFYSQEGNIMYVKNQDTLESEFINCDTNSFNFIITETKIYDNAANIICEILELNPNTTLFGDTTILMAVQNALEYSHDYFDFLLLLEEKGAITLSNIDEKVIKKILFVYSRDRKSSNDTGRLIYRMHCMGLIEDYQIDYQTKLFLCKFKKYNLIDDYIRIIEKYFRKYLSEISTNEKILKLKDQLIKPTLIENILECLYFLAEFAYDEIAGKRKRATDEIEKILIKSVSEPLYKSNWFEQNKFLKEEIFFYFNAKYARAGFKINSAPYSLLDDHKEQMPGFEILNKYLDVFQLGGAEQNNYKHMIGSCKKILRSLAETELQRDWVLRMLKAFSMYSINNPSYHSEANEDLEIAFRILYNELSKPEAKLSQAKNVIDHYFERLRANIEEVREIVVYNCIRLIHLKLLQKIQELEIENLLSLNKNLKEENYA